MKGEFIKFFQKPFICVRQHNKNTMKNVNFKNQSGAVLAFSLLMLVLLTLAATRMIQQNKQQLEMAGNVRLITQKFADAEGVLSYAKNTINEWDEHIDPDGISINKSAHSCVPIDVAGILKQDIRVAQVITPTTPDKPTFTILAVGCMTHSDSLGNVNTQKCSTYDETTQKTTCHPHAVDAVIPDPSDPSKTIMDHTKDFDCTGFSSTQVINNPAPKNFPSEAVAVNAQDLCYRDYDPKAVNNIITTKCPREVYTIKSVSKDEETGTTREIVSDHVVLCSSSAD